MRKKKSFLPLVCNVICYKCNNFGHKASSCRSGFVEPPI